MRNIRLFIAFRVFFSARFYYPVFTVLFLDFGLTIEQFVLLNAAWAATIVIVEVPSGALADTLGRRNLLVAAGVLMVCEMALLCFAPVGRPSLLFGIFLVNRVLSGMAEAAASGADEALAYDTLKAEGTIDDWGRVLERQMRIQSVAFILAMSMGAAVYDPTLMQRTADWLDLPVSLSQDITLRFPLLLTLITAVMALLAALNMHEPQKPLKRSASFQPGLDRSICEAFKLTLQAGGWILKTPFALMLIVSGLLFDHVIRMVMTLSSQYYRLISLPEASFGLVGSAMAGLGLFMPRVARKLVDKHSPVFNLGLVAVMCLCGLSGIALVQPFVGLAPIFLLYSVTFLTTFFTSHYLNRITSSEQRATVLSFKGLSFNLAYGLIGVLYALGLAYARSDLSAKQPLLIGNALENRIFIETLHWFPGYFLLLFSLLLILARRQLRNLDQHKKVG